MSAHLSGILLGLAAAASQSVSYFCSRRFVLGSRQPVLRLLVLSHVLMGGASLILLACAWAPPAGRCAACAVPLICTAGFYLAGQAGLFVLMRRIEASRVAPLLGLKIIVLALIATAFFGQRLAAQQWAAVLLCAAAALLLNAAGGRVGGVNALLLAATCAGYSLSDLGIVALVNALAPLPRMRAAVAGACMTYALCGAAGLAALPLVGRTTAREWRFAGAFAFFWFLGMVLLFACFACVGAIFGNILQSTRGVMSVGIGALLAGLGAAIEPRLGRRVFARRLAAAALMSAAIALYVSAPH